MFISTLVAAGLISFAICAVLIQTTAAQVVTVANFSVGLLPGTIVHYRDDPIHHQDYLAALKFFNNFCSVDELPQGSYPKYLVTFSANSTADVPKLLRFANGARLRVSVRSGGYHSAYASVVNVVDDDATSRKDFILLDFGNLKRISVDAVARRATIQSGVTYHELWQETIRYGLHFPGPHADRVNIAGFALGGGFGHGSRSFGSGADNIESVKVSTSWREDFQPIEVDSENHSDLLYAIRGAGLFFGVVTELTLRLHPIVPHPPSTPSLIAEQVKVSRTIGVFPSTQARAVLDFYADFDYNVAPTNLETKFVFTFDPQGNSQCVLGSHNYAPTVSDSTAAALQKITDFAQTIPNYFYLNTTIGYDELQTDTKNHWTSADLTYYAEDTFVPAPLPDGLKQALIDRWNVVPSVNSTIILNTGTWNSYSLPATALGFNGTYSLAIYSVWSRTGNDTLDQVNIDWVADTIKVIKPWTLGYYINELQGRRPGYKNYYEKCYEPTTWSKLQSLKAKYDPLGLFRSLTGSA